MFSERAFFSFIELTDPEQHREYNEWHQLDHRPENLLLPGVAWGDRWARRRDRDPATTADGELAGTDYVAMYWFRPPYERSIAEWTKLGEDSFQWGRGPMLPGVRRSLLAFFTPVKGYVAPRVQVSADALPFRPNRGLHVTVDYLADPHSAQVHEQFRWQDQVRIPDLLTCPGVAGAWTFALHTMQQHPTLPFDQTRREYASGSLRIRLLYLDGDPTTVTAEIAEREQQWDEAGRGAPYPEAEQTLLAGPVHTIVPWQDW
ncbi:hypothetical protein [Nocardia vermiculata]|uniref:Uncharacterized protein n=1 Tax=Nocardia vermiculata TaxID=257274 RepID=A0A846Y960_9NOCA|nr:hypothetical protein [Nocardia vermiculata]NKY54360.1 hypothetical protein [Nocardia vermiculata]